MGEPVVWPRNAKNDAFMALLACRACHARGTLTFDDHNFTCSACGLSTPTPVMARETRDERPISAVATPSTTDNAASAGTETADSVVWPRVRVKEVIVVPSGSMDNETALELATASGCLVVMLPAARWRCSTRTTCAEPGGCGS
jgi:hypothetical protein